MKSEFCQYVHYKYHHCVVCQSQPILPHGESILSTWWSMHDQSNSDEGNVLRSPGPMKSWFLNSFVLSGSFLRHQPTVLHFINMDMLPLVFNSPNLHSCHNTLINSSDFVTSEERLQAY